MIVGKAFVYSPYNRFWSCIFSAFGGNVVYTPSATNARR